MAGTITRPKTISVDDWGKLSLEEKKHACSMANGQAPKPDVEESKPENPDKEKTIYPSGDIRNWDEEIDGISGERIRNCIIFMLDHKKDPWYRLNLTSSYLHRTGKDGRTGARKLHEDTPPGWTVDPLFRIRTAVYEGEALEWREIARNPKNSEEWEQLHSELIDSQGKVRKALLPFLARQDCMKCKGRGGYNEKVFPDSKRRRWQEYFRCPCACCHFNPFKSPTA
jgi:hypothetical protein